MELICVDCGADCGETYGSYVQELPKIRCPKCRDARKNPKQPE